MSNLIKGIDFWFPDLDGKKEIIQNYSQQGYKIAYAQVSCANNITDTNLTIAEYVNEANMDIGFYGFVYGYTTQTYYNLTSETFFNCDYYTQGQYFGNAIKALEDNGYKTKLKLMIDIEASGFKIKNQYNKVIAYMTPPSGEEMYNAIMSYIDGVKSILGDREYIIYSSLGFSNEYFSDEVAEQCPLWVSTDNPTFASPWIDGTNPVTGTGLGSIEYWGGDNSWTAWQYEFAGNVDLDVFKPNIYVSESPETYQSFKVGEYVKIKQSTEKFAPDLIPQQDKGKQFNVESISGSNILLKGFTEWVNASDLSQVTFSGGQSNISHQALINAVANLNESGADNILVANSPGELYVDQNGNQYPFTKNLVDYITMYEGLSTAEAVNKLQGVVGNVRQAEMELFGELKFNQQQFDAMLSLAYNAGQSNSANSSGPLSPSITHSVFKYMNNNGSIQDLFIAFTEFDKRPANDHTGLFDRGFTEFCIFEFGVYRVIRGMTIPYIRSQIPTLFISGVDY